MEITAQALSIKILEFLTQYAEIKADYDPEYDDEDEKFASPDASILYAAAQMLKVSEHLPSTFIVHSSWDSGGYKPYSDKEGKALHDEIVIFCQQKIS